jgi:hypothetical protein
MRKVGGMRVGSGRSGMNGARGMGEGEGDGESGCGGFGRGPGRNGSIGKYILSK